MSYPLHDIRGNFRENISDPDSESINGAEQGPRWNVTTVHEQPLRLAAETPELGLKDLVPVRKHARNATIQVVAEARTVSEQQRKASKNRFESERTFGFSYDQLDQKVCRVTTDPISRYEKSDEVRKGREEDLELEVRECPLMPKVPVRPLRESSPLKPGVVSTESAWMSLLDHVTDVEDCLCEVRVEPIGARLASVPHSREQAVTPFHVELEADVPGDEALGNGKVSQIENFHVHSLGLFVRVHATEVACDVTVTIVRDEITAPFCQRVLAFASIDETFLLSGS